MGNTSSSPALRPARFAGAACMGQPEGGRSVGGISIPWVGVRSAGAWPFNMGQIVGIPLQPGHGRPARFGPTKVGTYRHLGACSPFYQTVTVRTGIKRDYPP